MESGKLFKRAIKEAKQTSSLDVPVGCAIIKDGVIIGASHNQKEELNDVTCHAEIIAIRDVQKKLGTWRLNGCEMYVTLEPCPMCASLISQARIKRVIYGAPDLKGGALNEEFNLYKQGKLNHYPEVTPGVLKEECSLIVSKYFQNKRKYLG